MSAPNVSKPARESSRLKSLPIDSGNQEAQVFNLTVLVRSSDSSSVSARAANLSIPEVEASTIREALSRLVTSAKSEIGGRLAEADAIPWIEPPIEPAEAESCYVVPLHL